MYTYTHTTLLDWFLRDFSLVNEEIQSLQSVCIHMYIHMEKIWTCFTSVRRLSWSGAQTLDIDIHISCSHMVAASLYIQLVCDLYIYVRFCASEYISLVCVEVSDFIDYSHGFTQKFSHFLSFTYEHKHTCARTYMYTYIHVHACIHEHVISMC